MGYDRYVGEPAYRQLTELYRAVRLYVNFFPPSVKLQRKQREGARVRRVDDRARTPYQRLAASAVLDAPTRDRWETIAGTLDPVRLLRQIQALQDALWRHAVLPPSAQVTAPATSEVRFDAQACSTAMEMDGEVATVTMAEPGGTEPQRRRYRRTPRKLGPRTYRTRPDPFAGVWDEIRMEWETQPERTAKEAFHALQVRYPGQFPDIQLRTLQRRVQQWRASVIVAFDDQWLREDSVIAGSMPLPRRAVELAPAAPTG